MTAPLARAAARRSDQKPESSNELLEQTNKSKGKSKSAADLEPTTPADEPTQRARKTTTNPEMGKKIFKGKKSISNTPKSIVDCSNTILPQNPVNLVSNNSKGRVHWSNSVILKEHSKSVKSSHIISPFNKNPPSEINSENCSLSVLNNCFYDLYSNDFESLVEKEILIKANFAKLNNTMSPKADSSSSNSNKGAIKSNKIAPKHLKLKSHFYKKSLDSCTETACRTSLVNPVFSKSSFSNPSFSKSSLTKSPFPKPSFSKSNFSKPNFSKTNFLNLNALILTLLLINQSLFGPPYLNLIAVLNSTLIVFPPILKILLTSKFFVNSHCKPPTNDCPDKAPPSAPTVSKSYTPPIPSSDRVLNTQLTENNASPNLLNTMFNGGNSHLFCTWCSNSFLNIQALASHRKFCKSKPHDYIFPPKQPKKRTKSKNSININTLCTQNPASTSTQCSTAFSNLNSSAPMNSTRRIIPPFDILSELPKIKGDEHSWPNEARLHFDFVRKKKLPKGSWNAITAFYNTKFKKKLSVSTLSGPC
ncbi:MAG: hypothetical protein MHPSP_003836 [Paramarteilia canceri]